VRSLGTIRGQLPNEPTAMTLSTPVVSLWLRRLAWGLAGLLALWVLAWFAVPPLLKSQAQTRLSTLLGRQVTVGAVDFSPWSLELTVRDLAVATADGKSAQFSVDACMWMPSCSPCCGWRRSWMR